MSRQVIDLCSTEEEESYEMEEVSEEEPVAPRVVFDAPLVTPDVTREMASRNMQLAPSKSVTRKPRTQAGARVTRVVFTLNNYSEEEHEWISSWIVENCKWGVVGKEVGDECQTPHLQGMFVSYVVSF